MGVPVQKHFYTIEDYLRVEESSPVRHEFHDGEILAVAGGSYSHGRIATNIIGMLHARLRGNPCYPLGADMRLRIGRRLSYVYPDVSVVCGPPQFDPDDSGRTTILNPRIVFEVLSDSAESYDRGAKFDLYREIPSLEDYVLVSQNQPGADEFFRQSDGVWFRRSYVGLDATVALQSLGISLPLKEIYAGIEFLNAV